MEPVTSVRTDKWLWATRIYKTRALAATACDAGHVRIEGHPIKPARPVRIGETITALNGEITRTVKVVALLDRRVGAKLVATYLEDLTPASEYAKRRLPNFQPIALRPKGTGRPTKKDRRETDNLWGQS